MQHEPARLVKAWTGKRASKILKPTRLIPSLVRYSQQRQAEGDTESEDYAVKYLRFVTAQGEHKDPAIYNYLVSLYAKQDDDTDLLEVSWFVVCCCLLAAVMYRGRGEGHYFFFFCCCRCRCTSTPALTLSPCCLLAANRNAVCGAGNVATVV